MDILGLGPPISMCGHPTAPPPNTQVLEPPLFHSVSAYKK